MKIVIAIIVTLHYNVVLLRAQVPTRGDYLQDYYEGDGGNGESPEEREPNVYPDEGPGGDAEVQFWEALLKLLQNKFASMKQQKHQEISGKGPAQFHEQEISGKGPAQFHELPKRPKGPKKKPNGHIINPYESHNQLPNLPLPTIRPPCKMREWCLRNCGLSLEPKCKKHCITRNPC